MGRIFEKRSRIIQTSEVGVCAGETLEESIGCNLRVCEICLLTDWTDWSACSTSCSDKAVSPPPATIN